MINELILVDEQDNTIGYAEKISVHKTGVLHRAFSIFIFDKKNNLMLIQKRSADKYHSAGLWSNACCSHQYKNETWDEALKRCIVNELGIQADFEYSVMQNYKSFSNIIQVGVFKYFSDYGDMKEHEIDHVILYTPEDTLLKKILYNTDEISEIRWLSIEELDTLLKCRSDEFTSWFSQSYDFVKKAIKELIVEDRVIDVFD
ncbi:NUDIX domain-containing protein [Ruminococcus sp. YE282]|uniref:isopentenyl-diphosphate Delta-isomerase n=1 Tax=Ruminococcus sp. YE282 TaxID=3158780 RepID=UPI00088D5202|nr:isopentenyl-diphosphate delta-isomerase [Ruminococcus bromii]